MAKNKTVFICSNCQHETQRWQGKCPACEEWNTLFEHAVVDAGSRASKRLPSAGSAEVQRLSEVSLIATPRLDTGFAELNGVLGGGLVQGSLVLLGGDPGIGKSTLLLQICDKLSNSGFPALYASGEESASQIKLRAKRLGIDGERLFLCAETDVDEVIAAMEAVKPSVMVIDSIQTMAVSTVNSSPGSVTQIRESAARFLRAAKQSGCAVFLVGHVTKEGALAGPRVLEHMVDTVLYFEGDAQAYRILRTEKNRFGSTNEIGVFEMTGGGMREVSNPSEMLARRDVDIPGSVVTCALEGTRPMLIEVQALISQTPFGTPRRMVTGAEYNRAVLILAVLEKRGGLRLFDQDVYVNIAGGLRVNEPAADLAIAAAVVTSFRSRTLGGATALMGEIGLTGEIRPVAQLQRRLSECARQGYARAIVPKAGLKRLPSLEGNISVEGISNISELLKLI